MHVPQHLPILYIFSEDPAVGHVGGREWQEEVNRETPITELEQCSRMKRPRGDLLSDPSSQLSKSCILHPFGGEHVL